MSDDELQSRRDFLQSSGKWSAAAILAALMGGVSNSPEAQAGAWINRRGGGMNGGGSWLNANGGGGGWINRRLGGGSWINRR